MRRGTSPTVTFSVEDPSGNGVHQYGNFYNIMPASTTDPEFATATAGTTPRLEWTSPGKVWVKTTTPMMPLPETCSATARREALRVDLLTSPGVSYQGNGVYLYNAADDSTPWTIPVLRRPTPRSVPLRWR